MLLRGWCEGLWASFDVIECICAPLSNLIDQDVVQMKTE